jgi:hypothetical protein
MIRQAIPGVAAANETGSAAATKARVIAEKNTNRLIVAAPLAGMADQIEALVNRLDKPPSDLLVGHVEIPRELQANIRLEVWLAVNAPVHHRTRSSTANCSHISRISRAE